MKKLQVFILTFITALALGIPSLAAIRPFYQDIKLPNQKVLEAQTISAPVLADADRLKAAYAGATSAAVVTLTSFLAQPDVPRNIVITPGGTTGDIESCVIVVNGTDFHGASISENFTFVANDTNAYTGSKAFKTVSSVVFPANCESGGFAATWDIGVGSKLGLKRCLANAGDVAWSVFNGAFESTRGTVAANASAVSSNTFIPNGTMDGVKDVLVYFVQNYAQSCQP